MGHQSGFQRLEILLYQTKMSNRFSKKMQQTKLKALDAGTLTDCYFLVGPEGGKIKVFFALSFHICICSILMIITQGFHAFSKDLQLASEVFQAMLKSPLTGPGPIRIRHIKPHIFNMLME